MFGSEIAQKCNEVLLDVLKQHEIHLNDPSIREIGHLNHLIVEQYSSFERKGDLSVRAAL